MDPLRTLERWLWNLDRFGYSPTKLGTRFRRPHAARVLCVALPKAGTHLLERALCLHRGLYRPLVRTINDRNLRRLGGFEPLLERLRGGEVLMAHLEHREERLEAIRRHGIKTLFMVRDPRDVLVSAVFFVLRRTDHPWHAAYRRRESMRERLRLALFGAPEEGVEPFTDWFDGYAGWFDDAGLVVRFEDLVGVAGGGSEARQRAGLEAIFDYLDMPLSAVDRDALAGRLVSRASPTFRRGQIGGWREQIRDRELQHMIEKQLATGRRMSYMPEDQR